MHLEYSNGFLDNLRNQCGLITMWIPILGNVPAPKFGIRTVFLTSTFLQTLESVGCSMAG